MKRLANTAAFYQKKGINALRKMHYSSALAGRFNLV